LYRFLGIAVLLDVRDIPQLDHFIGGGSAQGPIAMKMGDVLLASVSAGGYDRPAGAGTPLFAHASRILWTLHNGDPGKTRFIRKIEA
jgi:hypothetical protein